MLNNKSILFFEQLKNRYSKFPLFRIFHTASYICYNLMEIYSWRIQNDRYRH